MPRDTADRALYLADYVFRLEMLARSRAFRRRQVLLQLRLKDAPDHSVWGHTLSSVLLVEMRERSAFVRGLEWALQLCGAARLMGRDLTLGALQLSGSPWRLGDAARIAAARLESVGCKPDQSRSSLEQVARDWHGAATKQHGQQIGYADALEAASRLIARDGRPGR